MPGGVTSLDYEPEFDNYDSFAANDFVVQAREVWIITESDVVANPANLLPRPIRSMFFSTQIAARCQGRWLQAGSRTHTADSLVS